jgi:integrase
MQVGTVQRHGRGWRGSWREGGKRRVTSTYARKGEARAALNAELDRIAQGAAYRAPITFGEVFTRYRAQHDVQPVTLEAIRKRLGRPSDAYGSVLVGDVTPEELKLWLLGLPVGTAYRRDILRAMRQSLAWAERAKLIESNPARLVKLATPPAKSERILPFDSWAEVEQVAAEAGRWGPMIVFMVDCGARPQEIVALEHRHVDARAGRVFLPGVKSAHAQRTVHLTQRGVAAYQSIPRSIATPLAFHTRRGEAIHWGHWRGDVWRTALELAGLASRPPYSTRHTFAVWSLQAGVPIDTLAREMGHGDVSITHRTYGAWRVDMGERAASLRGAWATENAARGTIAEPRTT